MFKLINESSSPKSKLKKVAKFQHSLTAVFRAEIIPNLYIYILTINKAAHKGPQRERRVNCNKCTAKNKKTDSQKNNNNKNWTGFGPRDQIMQKQRSPYTGGGFNLQQLKATTFSKNESLNGMPFLVQLAHQVQVQQRPMGNHLAR